MQESLFHTVFERAVFVFFPVNFSLLSFFFFAAFSFVNIKEEESTPSGMRDARMFLQVFHGVVLSLKGLMLYISLHRCWMVSAVVMVLSCKPAVFTPDYKPSSFCNILLHSLTGESHEETKAHTSSLSAENLLA